MDEDALVVTEIAQLVRLDFVLFDFGVVDVAFPGAMAPRAFHDGLLAEKISRLDGVSFIGRPEDETVAEVQCEYFRFVVA